MVENQSAPLARPAVCAYADVVVPRHLTGPFTYLVPDALRPSLKIGQRVIVPFGRSQVRGAVTSMRPTLPPGLDARRIKPISSIVDDKHASDIPPPALDLARQVADYYIAPLGQCLRLIVPPDKHSFRGAQRLMLTGLGRAVLSDGHASQETAAFLKRLSRRQGGIRRETLRDRSRSRSDVLIETLLEKGWIIASEAVGSSPVNRGSRLPSIGLHDTHAEESEAELARRSVEPNPVQADWDERIAESLATRRYAGFAVQAPLADRHALLVGALRRTVADGRGALVIVGETERARWLARTLARAGIKLSEYFHHDMPEEDRALIWERTQRAAPQVVVGTRSSVFLPFVSLGLIWVEHAEDQSLKEPQEPRYHAGTVSGFRAQTEGAVLVLSSPHPLLETSVDDARIGQSLCRQQPPSLNPRIEAVDLRPLGKRTSLSPVLLDALRDAMARKAGALLFLNRKGYATALVCQDCGQVPRCEQCRVAFAYHRHVGGLSCSYCGAVTALPRLCSCCGGHRLKLIGEGTERVEDEVKRLFPDSRVLRVDGETARTRSQAAVLWQRIENRQWDILIGTQAVLRDYAVPPVGLVAAVQADTSLNLPDFRAAERTYQLLSEAAAMARPAGEGGRVLIQSYLPTHYAIQAVVQQNPSLFTAEELSHRLALRYPPAVHLIAVQVSGSKEGTVQEAAERLAGQLGQRLSGPGLNARDGGHAVSTMEADPFALLGPIPPAVPWRRGRHRRVILLKAAVRERGAQAVRDSVRELEGIYPGRVVKFDVDVDPVEMW